MKEKYKVLSSVVAAIAVSLFLVSTFLYAFPITPINGGGTGTSTAPTYGKVYVGDSNGNIEYVATSSLGISSGGSGTVGSGTQGQFPFYNANGTTLTATSSIFITQSGSIGIGTSTPNAQLMVEQTTGASQVKIQSDDGINQSSLQLNDGNTLNNTFNARTNPVGAANVGLNSIPLSTFLGVSTGSTGGLIVGSQNTTAPVIFSTGGTAFTNERMRITSAGLVGIGTSTPTALLHLQGTSGAPTDLVDVSTSTGSTYLQIQPGGEVNIANSLLSGSSATDNVLKVTGTYPAVQTANMVGADFIFTPVGSATFSQNALKVLLQGGYTGSSVTSGLSVQNSTTGTGTTGITGGTGNFGIISTVNGAGPGNDVGGRYLVSGSSSLNLGMIDSATSATSFPALNVGLVGIALNATSSVAGYFGLETAIPAFTSSSSIIADNGSTGDDIFEGRVNGAVALTINGTGHLGIGTSTPFASLDIATASSTAGAIQTNPFNQMAEMTIKGVWYIIQTFDYYGHKYTSGPAPTVTGGTSSVSGNDNNGTITVTGTALTSVTLNFANPWSSAPDCIISDNSTGLTVGITSISTTQMVVGFSIGVTSGTVYYQCIAHR